VGHQDYFLVPLLGSIALFVSSLRIHIVRCNQFIMGKPRDGKFSILPSTKRGGTTLNTSISLDSPSSTVLDESGLLGSFLDATIARTKQMGNTTVTPVSSPESRECPSDDLEEAYIELDDDFIHEFHATSDAGAIRDLLARRAVGYKLSPDAKFAVSPINISDKDYDFSLDLSYISIIEKEPFCGTKNESVVGHMNELSALSNLFSDDTKLRTYFVAKIFPFSLKGAAKAQFNNLSPRSIDSPIALVNAFFQKYFPASSQHAAL
jgi:hypothetical protein